MSTTARQFILRIHFTLVSLALLLGLVLGLLG